MTAANGSAAGIAATVVGVFQTNSTPIGVTPQRIDGVWTDSIESAKGERNGSGGDGGEPDAGDIR